MSALLEFTLSLAALAVGFSVAFALLMGWQAPLWMRLTLWDIPVWLLYGSFTVLLDLIGLALLLPLCACHAWRQGFSRVYTNDGTPLGAADENRVGRPVDRWCGGWLTWLWGNEEDGVTGPVWWQRQTGVRGAYPMVGMWWQKALSAYRWSALRNPSNNLRFVPALNPVIQPALIQASNWTGVLWFGCTCSAQYVRHGAFAGLWVRIYMQHRAYRLLIGWKLQAQDSLGVEDRDYRKPRCGFGLQFKRVFP